MSEGTDSSLPAVVVDAVSKSFRLPHERVHTLKERVLHPLRQTGHDELRALREVSFAVQPGEFFGIVGRNGSGKSTLLKCMAGIYGVDRGAIYVNGRVATFIELGVGFNPDLAARDNITLNGIMLGLTPSEARERVEQVIDFAELHKFTDMKLKNYSSGMQVRLAFSVMIQVDADILLIDEVLAVGDASFQQKCFDQFHRLREEKRTILFVTHDMPAVSRFCDRAMLLEKGEMTLIGQPDTVADEYIAVNFPHEAITAAAARGGNAPDAAAVIGDCWFQVEGGDRNDYVGQGESCAFKAVVAFTREMDDPIFTFWLENDNGDKVFATSTLWAHEETGTFKEGDRAVIGVTFENLTTPGRYWGNVQISRRGSGSLVIDRREKAATMVTTGTRKTGGIVDLPHDVEVARLGTGAVPEPEGAL